MTKFPYGRTYKLIEGSVTKKIIERVRVYVTVKYRYRTVKKIAENFVKEKSKQNNSKK